MLKKFDPTPIPADNFPRMSQKFSSHRKAKHIKNDEFQITKNESNAAPATPIHSA
jgi:hypothetical protein